MNISPEVQGGIIGALIGGFLLFIGFYFRTHVGNKVLIIKTSETFVTGFSDSRGNSLSFNFKNIPIESLYFAVFKFINNGYAEIEDLNIVLKVIPKNETELLEVQLLDYLYKAELTASETYKHSYMITRPYLNMVRKDKDEAVYIQIFSDTECDYQIFGGGKGWKTEFQKPPSKIFKPSLYMGVGAYGGLLFSLIRRFSIDGLNEWEIVYSVAFSLVIVFIIWLIAKIELIQKSRKLE